MTARRLIGLLLAAATPAYAAHDCGTAQWTPLIAEAAERFTLPPDWLHAVMHAESAGCALLDGSPTTSSAGAMGLMQLMPATWREQRERLSLGHDPYTPRDNILAGASYLRELFDRYGWPGASAAYHAGPARYEESLTGGRALPASTQRYVARIERALSTTTSHGPLTKRSENRNATPDDSPKRSVFANRSAAESSAASHVESTRTDSVFVRLRQQSSHVTSTTSEAEHVQPR